MALYFEESFSDSILKLYYGPLVQPGDYEARTVKAGTFDAVWDEKNRLRQQYKLAYYFESWLSSGSRALVGWLVNSKHDCRILVDQDSLQADAVDQDAAEKGKPCSTRIYAPANANIFELAHEMIHAHHMMNDPWNANMKGTQITTVTQNVTENNVPKEEARTVGLGEWCSIEYSPAAPKQITENMIRSEFNEKLRLKYQI